MSRKSVAAIVVSIALVPGGAAMAGPSPEKADPYPASEGWVQFDDRFTVPAGYACARAVRVRSWGHLRVTVNGEPVTEETELHPGDVIVSEGPDDQVRITNRHNKRRVTVRSDGKFTDVVTRNGDNLRSVGSDGANVFLGPRVTGILWSDGITRFSVLDFRENGGDLLIRSTEGATRDLCSAVGTNPVVGKLPPAFGGEQPRTGALSDRRHLVR